MESTSEAQGQPSVLDSDDKDDEREVALEEIGTL